MVSNISTSRVSGSLFPFLDRTRTIAKPSYNKWMVQLGALCRHLCIGQAYAFEGERSAR